MKIQGPIKYTTKEFQWSKKISMSNLQNNLKLKNFVGINSLEVGSLDIKNMLKKKYHILNQVLNMRIYLELENILEVIQCKIILKT